ncbi:MAG: hypothetical protein QOG37_2998, partial [Mycobacterium sp.]|nr:hypothetical protein [Mycobacterium sp.]
MSGSTRGSLLGALKVAGIASVLGLTLVLSASPAVADPDPAPGDPVVVAPPPAEPAFNGPVPGENPAPFTGTAPFAPPRINPANGATVGVAQPIII